VNRHIGKGKKKASKRGGLAQLQPRNRLENLTNVTGHEKNVHEGKEEKGKVNRNELPGGGLGCLWVWWVWVCGFCVLGCGFFGFWVVLGGGGCEGRGLGVFWVLVWFFLGGGFGFLGRSAGQGGPGCLFRAWREGGRKKKKACALTRASPRSPGEEQRAFLKHSFQITRDGVPCRLEESRRQRTNKKLGRRTPPGAGYMTNWLDEREV